MCESILKRVENIREEMIQSALDKGISDQHTILLSKKLDKLLNEFQYKANSSFNLE